MRKLPNTKATNMGEEPLPETTVSEIIGLLEVIKDYRGKEDIAKLADDFDLEIDEILPEVEAAELLGFVVIENGDIKLTEKGIEILRSEIKERRRIFKEQLLKLDIFKNLISYIREKGGKAGREEIFEFLKLNLPGDFNVNFKDIVNWGRYANIITYDSENDEIKLVRN